MKKTSLIFDFLIVGALKQTGTQSAYQVCITRALLIRTAPPAFTSEKDLCL
jgi:hypothetical protein